MRSVYAMILKSYDHLHVPSVYLYSDGKIFDAVLAEVKAGVKSECLGHAVQISDVKLFINEETLAEHEHGSLRRVAEAHAEDILLECGIYQE